MPTQDRVGLHHEDGPAVTAEHTRERGEDRSVVGFEARPDDLAPQHGDLVAQHQDLDILGTIPAATQHQQVDHEPDKTIETGHASILPALKPCSSPRTRNTSSTDRTSFRHPQAINRGRWVWGWRRGDDTQQSALLTEREAISYMARWAAPHRRVCAVVGTGNHIWWCCPPAPTARPDDHADARSGRAVFGSRLPTQVSWDRRRGGQARRGMLRGSARSRLPGRTRPLSQGQIGRAADR
jgi:hypothetical protein